VTVPAGPILTAHLFRGLHGQLMAVLRGISRDDWQKPTRAGSWRVRDVAAHLLDGDCRKLTFHRDGVALPPPDNPITDHASLVAHLDALNADWVKAARRIGPKLLVEMLERTGVEVAAFVEGLDMQARALFSVAWAGEDVSLNWMDTGREYTERWHHQQQIREAVGAPPLTRREWLHPVLDVSMWALPFAYRDVEAPEGQAVAFRVMGQAGGNWSVRREAGKWRLFTGETEQPACRVIVDADTAWRIFFKAITPEEAAARVRIEGEARLGQPFLGTLAVMARRQA
jgi:uncharacterized protein (TIGR03083 family)